MVARREVGDQTSEPTVSPFHFEESVPRVFISVVVGAVETHTARPGSDSAENSRNIIAGPFIGASEHGPTVAQPRISRGIAPDRGEGTADNDVAIGLQRHGIDEIRRLETELVDQASELVV